ncbi:MAG: hypothetical protein ACRDD1_07385, partial [Planctomycetia bacterium]
MRYAPEPSVAERARKWARRNPRQASAGTVAMASVLFVAVIAAGAWQGFDQLRRLQFQEDVRLVHADLQKARYLLNLPHPTTEQLDAGLAICRSRIEVLESRPMKRAADAVFNGNLVDAQKLRDECGELYYLLVRAELQRRGKPLGPTKLDAKRLLEWNQRAIDAFGDGCAPLTFCLQRAQLLAADGREAQANEWRKRADSQEPHPEVDWYFTATQLMTDGRLSPTDALRKAETLLVKLVDEAPQTYWGWIALGGCRSSLGRDREAVASFDAAIALEPEYPWGYHLRGMTYLRLLRNEQAERDLRRAADRDPGWFEPRLLLAAARQRESD